MEKTYDVESFYNGLVAHGLIIPTTVQGAFGRGAVFEDVLERFNALVSEIARDDGAEVYTFPPIIDRSILERVHYLDSFPHLCSPPDGRANAIQTSVVSIAAART